MAISKVSGYRKISRISVCTTKKLKLKFKRQYQLKFSKIQAYLIWLHFPLLCFTDTVFFCYILSLWQICFKQTYWHHFPTAFVHFVSLCHILVTLAIFQTLSLLLYLTWWCVISDFWCYYHNLFGGTMRHTHIRLQT